MKVLLLSQNTLTLGDSPTNSSWVYLAYLNQKLVLFVVLLSLGSGLSGLLSGDDASPFLSSVTWLPSRLPSRSYCDSSSLQNHCDFFELPRAVESIDTWEDLVRHNTDIIFACAGGSSPCTSFVTTPRCRIQSLLAPYVASMSQRVPTSLTGEQLLALF